MMTVTQSYKFPIGRLQEDNFSMLIAEEAQALQCNLHGFESRPVSMPYKLGSGLPRVPEECPEQIAQLYVACLAEDPEQRPKAADLVKIITAAQEAVPCRVPKMIYP
jgi:hypothetical protein